MRLNIVLSFLCLFFIETSCGYFENDKTQYEVSITDKIKVRKQKNNKQVTLVYQENQDFSTVLVEDCKSIYYDSVSAVIFCELFINEFNRQYFKIDIINREEKNNLKNSFKKMEISETMYLEKIKQLTKIVLPS